MEYTTSNSLWTLSRPILAKAAILFLLLLLSWPSSAWVQPATNCCVRPNRSQLSGGWQHRFVTSRSLAQSTPEKKNDRSLSLLVAWAGPLSITLFLVFSSVVSAVALASYDSAPQDDNSPRVWQFANGSVQLAGPVMRVGSRTLQNPRLLGSGAGGAVFAVQEAASNPGSAPGSSSPMSSTNDYVLKISWEYSTPSVQKECRILQILQERQVSGVEQCLDMVPYHPMESDRADATTTRDRVMILLLPVFANDAASVQDLSSSVQVHAVQMIVRTLVHMLCARVVTTDVQPLFSAATGDVLFIDMTEAQVLPILDIDLSITDQALANSFVSEMLALIPSELYLQASQALLKELDHVSSQSWAAQPTWMSSSSEAARTLRPSPFMLDVLLQQTESMLSPPALARMQSLAGLRH